MTKSIDWIRNTCVLVTVSLAACAVPQVEEARRGTHSSLEQGPAACEPCSGGVDEQTHALAPQACGTIICNAHKTFDACESGRWKPLGTPCGFNAPKPLARCSGADELGNPLINQ